MHTVHQHIHLHLLEILRKRRSMSKENFSLEKLSEINLDIQIPGIVSKLTHRHNIIASTPDEYFRIFIYIPYASTL